MQVVKVMNMLYVNWNGKFVDTRTRGLTMWHLWLSQFQNKYQDSLNNFSCVMLILNYRIYYNISIYVYHCIYFGIRYYISGKCPCLNKMGGKYHTVGTIPKSNIKITEICKIDTPNTQIYNRSLSRLDTGTSTKSDRVKLVVFSQTSHLSNTYKSLWILVSYQLKLLILPHFASNYSDYSN